MEPISIDYPTVEEYYEVEGVQVWVIVPTQAQPRALVIETDTVPTPEQMQGTPNVFRPIVGMINFQVKETQTNFRVDRFNPPMVLRVGIPDIAKEGVRDGHTLKLAFWNGERWILFTKEKHHLQIHDDFAIVLIRDWGDPTVGWGD